MVVSVHSISGIYNAPYLINAIPLQLSSKIHYIPQLPRERILLTQATVMGSVIKTVTVYNRPWWRERGYSGQFAADTGPITATYDDSIEPKQGKQYRWAIMGFIAGKQTQIWGSKTLEERKKAIVEQYKDIWECDEALHPKDYYENDWTLEEYSGGCYFGRINPGFLSSVGKVIREPFDRIHWAGTETARVWMGYMEGAVEAGERAANEIIDRVKSSS